ncbi:low-specificity L-threonine aldolase [Pseudoalteromonas obscura]|uniref:Low-specificity L-threonine aldolase n=1 Tax=Pseudoalteromonas obscura TaxID=3048491 RepID=A0ABT7EQC1_9GAMM|nr:low-specificity L-threonine aldolase [Pseudoalteromonas sp. P94(2023)]MDK2597264.1 low-specificity L-threonine aldolase [Pseudoalteromonas sp. P94(2023)]
MIDFRSDTVTQPCKNMRRLMSNAMVGDDVYGDDPTVNELEHYSSVKHGFDASIFVTSGTQANLLAILAHCERGDEYICGQGAHNYKYEAGGAAVLGSVQPQPLENLPNGEICLEKVVAAIKPNDFHFARTKMLSLENTIGGKVLSLAYLSEARSLTKKYGLQHHLDGARVYNAAVALGVDIKEISQHFDSMTVCLSKGLGAPVGSLLMGSFEFIEKARRLRKMLGGGMRQAGILAAGGLYALKNNVERLEQDHEHARYLASRINELPGFDSTPYEVQTNLVFLNVDSSIDIQAFTKAMYDKGINMTPGYQGMRLVTHSGIDKSDIDNFIDVAKANLA